MDEASRTTIEYLRRLPPGAVVRWSSHHVSASRPWTSRWIDIRIEDEAAPPFNWVWTIIGEDDPDGTAPDQLWQFVWRYDLDVHEVWGEPDGPEVERAVSRESTVPEDVQAALAPGRRHVVLGGWSVEAVNRALTDWATRHAGRSDLQFEWDPQGEPYLGVLQAARRAKEIDEGGPVWDLGEGLVVADEIMDELLGMDPEERDGVMRMLREAHDRLLGTRDSGSER